jgi:hypothetical protein
MPSTATTIACYHQAVTGTLVVTGTVPALGAGETVTATTPWDWGELEEGSYPLVAVVNQGEGGFAERYLANNQADLTLEVIKGTAWLRWPIDEPHFASVLRVQRNRR